MSHAAWDGQRLDCDPLSLVLLRIGEARPAPILAAGAGEGQWVIRPEQIGEFLRAHRETLIICHDVGPLFWTISDHLRGGSDQTALDVWWDWPRSGRLRDVMLLDQLIREANHRARPDAASLPDLAGRTLGVTLATEATSQARSSVQAQGLGQQANSDSLDDLCRRAGAVLGTYKALLGVADQIIRAQGIDPTSIGRFGPLALNLQVQGAIALAAAERAGLAMDEAARQEIVKACEAVGKASIETLWGDTEARRCLVHDGDGPKLTATGFPKFRKRSLELWLDQLAASMACLHAIPFTPPMSADGRTSTDPAEWGFWRRCHPLLRAWSDLMAASSLRHRYAQSNEPMVTVHAPSGRIDGLPV